jgi:hypothetical protein
MSWQASLAVAILSGVLVPVILAFGRDLWHFGAIPRALSRTVRRPRYLSAVLAASTREDTGTLDVLAPRLLTANSSEMIKKIQVAWKRINDRERGRVRVLTLDSDACIEGGAELLRDDIEVRVARRDIGTESLSFHLFETGAPVTATAIVNHREKGEDQPVLLQGEATTAVFRAHFETLWQKAQPLESVITERILSGAGSNPSLPAVMRSLSQAAVQLKLDPVCVEKLLPHLAFQHTCPVLFIVGQPGAGKSFVRRQLARQLQDLHIGCCALTDYVYAYRDHLNSLLKIEPARAGGFKAFDGGAFVVRDESVLAPALRALALAVRDSAQTSEVTLVEFARSDLVGSLRVFDEADLRSEVIYVRASEQLRSDRLRRRANPPVTHISGECVNVRLSDNHLLPSDAERSLYGVDGFQQLMAAPRWRERVFVIDNDVDDNGDSVNAKLSDFIGHVVARWSGKQPSWSTGQQLAS